MQTVEVMHMQVCPESIAAGCPWPQPARPRLLRTQVDNAAGPRVPEGRRHDARLPDEDDI
jgi:hypothetical protein